ALRQLLEEWIVGKQAAGAVQEHERRAAAAFEDPDTGAALRGNRRGLHRSVLLSDGERSAPGRPSSGCTRSAIGVGHQRLSSFHSGHMSRKCGMTCSANSFEEWRVFQSGMLPLWNRQKTWPMCRPLIISSICWRTVVGLPAMT